MRADRLISLVLLLQTRGRMTALELSERLEVSERTIYRDLDALSGAGIPIYGEHGPGGGYALLDSYRSSLTGLTEGQVRALMLSSSASPLADLGLGQDMEAVLLKLLAALPSAQRQGAEDMRQRIHLDPSWWFQGAEDLTHLPLLQQAIWNDRRLYITYTRGNGEAGERLIEPYGLVAKASVWYLVASIGDDMRVFRVSRLGSVKLCEDCFTRPADFDLGDYWQKWSQQFEHSLPQITAQLRLSPHMAEKLPQMWGENLRQRIQDATPDAEGWVTIPVYFDSMYWAAANIIGLGNQAQVIEPAELREQVISLAREVAGAYV